MPHFFSIKDIHEPYSVVNFGREIPVKPAYKPQQFYGSRRFCADKADREDIWARSFGALKKQIDKIEEKG